MNHYFVYHSLTRKYGVSFFNPQLPEWSTRYIPLEAAVKDTCSLLLYVISDETRGISSMIEVSRSITVMLVTPDS